MNPESSRMGLEVGDNVTVISRTRFRGRLGSIVKICPVKVGVKFPGFDALVYYKPQSLKRDVKNDATPQADPPTAQSVDSDDRVIASYLAGCEALTKLTRGKAKAEAVREIQIVLEAWRESVEAIASGCA